MNPTERFREFRAACWKNREHAARMLVEDPSLIDVRNGIGETVLHWSAIEANADVVRFLLDRGASADPRNEFGGSALQECVQLCEASDAYLPLVELLLGAGADALHASDTHPCAWHFAELSQNARLRSLFETLPAPADRHEMCDLYALVMSDDPFPDEPSDDAQEPGPTGD